MRVFPKLLLLLTTLALIPLSTVTVYEWIATRNLSTEIASHASTILVTEASGKLELAVETFARLVKEQAQTMEMMVKIQAAEMQRLLAVDPPAMPGVFFSEDYDQRRVPGMIAASPKYDRMGSDGKLIPGSISLSDPDFKLASGVNREAVAGEIARLAALAPVYRTFFEKHSDILVSLYTALESGVISSYPGMGGFPQDYDPRLTSWYTTIKEANGLVWTPPSVDETGLGILLGLGMPVYGPDGSFAGVTAIDVANIQELPSALPNTPWAAGLQVFLAFVDARPDTKEMGLRLIGVKDYHRENKDWRAPPQEEWLEPKDQDKYQQMIRAIRMGKSGTISMPYDGRDSLWAYGLIDSDATALIFIVPMENIVAKAKEMREFILGQESQEMIFFGAIAMLAIGFVVYFSYLGSRSIANPLRALAKATAEIAAGNLEVSVPAMESRDEVGDLTRAVTCMKTDLKKYIHDLTEATVSRERIESELRIAREIQMSFLPRVFPQPLRGKEFSVFAAIQPAREVGGDLYDVFLLDDTNLFFAIGDVSGKGIPAALFMARAKTLMKSVAREFAYPHEILTAMNTELRQGNDACMFVTFQCGMLNTGTGEVLFCNAGHNPPLLTGCRKEATFFETNKSLILGVCEEAEYSTQGFVLSPGDGLFLYTDGVTEAADENDGFYSSARLQEDVSSLRGLSPEETITGVMDRLRSFCGSAPQSDDITVLMMRFN